MQYGHSSVIPIFAVTSEQPRSAIRQKSQCSSLGICSRGLCHSRSSHSYGYGHQRSRHSNVDQSDFQ